jgi:hypothetical protein
MPAGSSVMGRDRLEKAGELHPQVKMKLLWVEMCGGIWGQAGRGVGYSSTGIAKIPANAQVSYLKYRMKKGV